MNVLETLDMLDALADLKEYGRMKDRLVVRPYPADAPGVEDSIHKTIGDIALVLYAVLHEGDGMVAGAKVPVSMGEGWGIPGGELLGAALRNSMGKDQPRILDMLGVLDDPEGYAGIPLEEFEWDGSAPCGSTCLTTRSKMNGAVAAFMPGVAEGIAEAFGSDFYLVFTSVHEAMLHPVGEIDVETLVQVLEDTIRAGTPEGEVLTHRIYRYFREKGEIRLA